ncbi:MAG: Holliday junction branch migration protein RuvA [Gammaproteobacteria bacterium]|jgi:Holliday junction DNA helicase RuvA|nr:Holliday junction branch migration protein RuvA [Gammaproteobacteria bacterium]MDH3848387.1 Holliday junction branch migration protein RuvA [Gammaproteobacteria bacterium]MDH3864284.1 Holliday junction branch migration protein RuvA [Gammaproteobacteria bacterium]MDH3905796.1 Holliday junction branch migration protein RuvA [Gammaproteobacteria bacterium]MDH3952921.1 Holliday junction branch migration protein RuvA [Gammaproteobacteria bacterium]
MIASLRGRLTLKQAPSIIIECHGVGYEVETPMSTFLELPPTGDELFLFTHMVVREDAQTLYGFATEEERGLFRMLLKISGVGAKMGLAVLSSMSVDGFRRCVEYEDAASLVKVPGIGRKTAERLIIEMRDRIDTTTAQSGATKVDVEAGAKSEAVDALISLGYKPREVQKLIGELDVDGKSAEDIIRLALRQVAL